MQKKHAGFKYLIHFICKDFYSEKFLISLQKVSYTALTNRRFKGLGNNESIGLKARGSGLRFKKGFYHQRRSKRVAPVRTGRRSSIVCARTHTHTHTMPAGCVGSMVAGLGGGP